MFSNKFNLLFFFKVFIKPISIFSDGKPEITFKRTLDFISFFVKGDLSSEESSWLSLRLSESDWQSAKRESSSSFFTVSKSATE